MKYIAFDIGDKRIGVAVSDPFGDFALPLETYYRKNFKKGCLKIRKGSRRGYHNLFLTLNLIP